VTNSEDSEAKMKVHQKKEAKLWEATTIFRRKYQPKLMLYLNRGVLWYIRSMKVRNLVIMVKLKQIHSQHRRGNAWEIT
jgi:hypothetical protein